MRPLAAVLQRLRFLGFRFTHARLAFSEVDVLRVVANRPQCRVNSRRALRALAAAPTDLDFALRGAGERRQRSTA